MPYTLLHPGFTTPLYRKWPRFFSFIGLIVGSIVPDLDIIYRFSETRYHIFSYSMTNITTVLLPISIIMYLYLKFLWFPISRSGSFNLSPTLLKKTFIQIPKIIFSILIGISIHLFLDNFAHFNDTSTLATQIKNNLGYEQNEVQLLEVILIYLPQLAISGIGFLFTFYYLCIYRKKIYSQLNFLFINWKTSSIAFIIISISFTSMKIIKAGIENYLVIDSLIIGMTCGLVSAIILTPIFVYLFKKISAVPRELVYLFVWVFFLYSLGLPKKEYLSIFIAKEVFIIIISFGLYFLFRRWILPSNDTSTIKLIFLSTTLSILSSCAYYISNKGLGPGIFVISFVSFVIIFQYLKTQIPFKTFKYLDKLGIIVLIANANTTLGVITTCVTFILIAVDFIRSNKNFNILNFRFYIVLLPIISVIYIGGSYSKLYGLFCLSQYLIAWLFIFSNYFVSKETEPFLNETYSTRSLD